MKKQNQPGIYFFEVEKQDVAAIRKEVPGGVIFTETFSAKTAPKCKDAEVLCGFIYSDFSAKNLQKCPRVKLIVTRSVGYNHIDLKWCQEHGIAVCNVPDYGSHVIAEHVFALLLASIRNVLQGEERTAHDRFSWKGLRGIALKGKTLGIVGTGKIGNNVARIASLGFLMNVIAYDPHPDPESAMQNHFRYVRSLDDIWKKSDVISLHVPLFPETRHMINRATIAKMRKGVILINTARGELIETGALVKAIRAKKFGHVALDVIEHEKNLREDKELLHLPDVIITPHIAFYADDSMARMIKESCGSIRQFLKHKELTHQVHGH